MDFVRDFVDDQKPSLFELLAEHELNALLPPTLRYLLVLLTQRHPRYLLRVLNRFDELYALASLAIERHYLRTRAAGFTEAFYGLKRERALVGGEIPRAAAAAPGATRRALRLSEADVWRNLLVMVGVPYLKRKLDEAHEVDAPRARLGVAYTQLPAGASWRQKLEHYFRWFLRHVYPSVNAAYYFALMAFQLAYLFDGTKYHHPLLWLVGTRMRRMTAADQQAVDLLSGAGALPKPAVGAPPGPRSFFSPSTVVPRLMSGLSLALPASIFALKFLEWWHASDFARQMSRQAAESIELPPPVVAGLPDGPAAQTRKSADDADRSSAQDDGGPETHAPSAETAPIATPSLLPIFTVPPPADSALCPICGDEIATPTACQTGVVYCYACIHRWVEGVHPKQESFMRDKVDKWESGRGRCAVTGRRVLGGTECLRRIMV